MVEEEEVMVVEKEKVMMVEETGKEVNKMAIL
jgi:hypothetical protein